MHVKSKMYVMLCHLLWMLVMLCVTLVHHDQKCHVMYFQCLILGPGGRPAAIPSTHSSPRPGRAQNSSAASKRAQQAQAQAAQQAQAQAAAVAAQLGEHMIHLSIIPINIHHVMSCHIISYHDES